jgi:putative DNA primase/helicase
MMERFSDQLLAEIRRRTSLVGLVRATVKLRNVGAEFVGLCPFHVEKSPSFSVNDGKGVYLCRGCGAAGDALGFIMRLRGLSFAEAVRRLAADVGVEVGRTAEQREHRPPRTVHPPQAAKPDPEAKRRSAFVRWLWQETWSASLPARGSPIERWLAARRITLDPASLDAAPLRWSPACPLGKATAPAVVALMTDAVTGEATGIHRTFLQPDGSAKAGVDQPRMMLGNAGVIRLSPDEDVTQGLGICEGVETGMAIMSTDWLPIWAAGSLGAVRSFPVLAGIECLTIFADPKPNEIAGARECGRRWRDAGRQAVLRIPGNGDWNDALVAR